MMKKLLTKIFFVFFVAMFIFSSYKIISIKINLANEKKEFEELRELVSLDNNNISSDNTTNDNTTNDNTTNDNTTNEMNEKYNTLKGLNLNYKFWISIPGTKIDYPVVQGNNNNYYLKKSFSNKKSSSGSIFLDSRCNENSSNIVIYGHNMKNGTMFHNLRHYEDNNFFNEHKYINIETKDGLYIYEIFSSYFTPTSFNYIQTDFSSKDEYSSFLNEIKNKSQINSDLEVTEEDKILTLSTCSYEGDNYRRAVHAKLIEIKK